MQANLDKAIDFILQDEGGFAERATEPGGAVNRGVSLAAFSAWRISQGRSNACSVDDLKAMTADEAIAIYNANYASKINFSKLVDGLDYAVLDAAVNEGIGAANGLLSVTSPLTDVKARIQAISDIRLLVKRARPEWAKFGPGWTARIGTHVPQRALAMIGG